MIAHAKKVHRSTAGASLLELVCALFIVTVGLFGIMQMYIVALDKTKTLNEYAIANAALNNEIETRRARPFSDLTVGTPLPFISETPTTDLLVNAKGTVTIRDHSATRPHLKELHATFRWQGENGRFIEKSFSTLIADKGAIR